MAFDITLSTQRSRTVVFNKMADPPSHVHPTESPSPRPLQSYNYPFAAGPDIIRANQKDTYFQSVLHEQFSTILRKFYGSRITHTYNAEARTFTELLYLGLTTLVGNRTLGEEYCDIIQVSGSSLRLPAFARRAGYILSVVLLPYILTKILPAFRNRIRLKLEKNLQHKSNPSHSSLKERFQSYLLENLPTITSPSPLYALTLSIFYFTGSYYHLSKRLFGLRYIFTKRLAPSDQRVGYEVLGVLLVLQIAAQGWLQLQSIFKPSIVSLHEVGSLADGSTSVNGVEVGLSHQTMPDTAYLSSADQNLHPASKTRLEATTHTPLLKDKPRYDLRAPETMTWIQGRQQRKCTLCLEELKDPGITTCGHVFCWTCIGDWVREKPECPLCRQGVLEQHILPLRG